MDFSRPVKIDTIDTKGFQETLTATSEECIALANRFEVLAVRDLTANVEIKQESAKTTYHVTGTLNATVVQECVVSGQEIENNIKEDFDAWFTDESKIASFAHARQEKDEEGDEHEMRDESDDPEKITNGVIDVGEVVAQYLSLAIDPYPHATGIDEGDYIETKPEDKPNPFAKLAVLKEKK